jgi:phospholipase/carboxylesterase
MSDLDSIARLVTDDTLPLVHRVRQPAPRPDNTPHPTLIMIHGFEGNEDVTWIFSRAADPDWLIVTPRAPLRSQSGYTWYGFDPATKVPEQASVDRAQATLHDFIQKTLHTYHGDPNRVVLLGFSQGAAMAALYGIAHPERVRGIVSLGGFIPRLNEITLPPLNGLPILILHGTQDETIPVKYAQRARERLTEAGATVTYEELDVGHKVSAQGMRTLGAWLAERK